MKINSCFFFFLIFFPLFVSSVEKKVYIVYLREHNGEKALHEIERTHRSYLHSVKESEEDAESSLLYSYKHSINGFAARLTQDEASKLSAMEEVVSVLPSHVNYTVHTTRSWEFLGLQDDGSGNYFTPGKHDLLKRAQYGKNVIIGVIDTGVWPESLSFHDYGMDPIPKSWNGICQQGVAFDSSHCNRKIIGARYYVRGFESRFGPVNPTEDFLSPRDVNGHGSHTASIAAGRQVDNVAAVGGIAQGTAYGGAPFARLAIYKACWAIPKQPKITGFGCFAEDVIAAIDDAIGDGVHILSASLGPGDRAAFEDDFVSMGALSAARHNILVVAAAGNSGPKLGTVVNSAPWILTVAASSLDREFSAPVILGNGLRINGYSIAPFNLKNQMYPLVYAGHAALPGVSQSVAGECLFGSLDPYKVQGKIVLCFNGGAGFRSDKGVEVNRAGGVGLILANSQVQGYVIFYDAHFLSATAVAYDDGIKILEYIFSTMNPIAYIYPTTTVLHHKPAPFVAGFSSRGPNMLDYNILKPDMTAPGLQILAAWSEAASPTNTPVDKRSVKYNFQSGTSMSCPHVSGVAALLKAIHPDWSIAAIKSALMTTASITNNKGLPITDNFGNIATPFHFGSGHVQPTKAADPGLIYDSSYDDYLLYLCRASPEVLDRIWSRFNCPYHPPSTVNFNYPSLVVRLYNVVTVTRTVTNVGRHRSKYVFIRELPPGVDVVVSPTILYFNRIGQKQSFNLTIIPKYDPSAKRSDYGFGWYAWSDGREYYVKSSMAVYLP